MDFCLPFYGRLFAKMATILPSSVCLPLYNETTAASHPRIESISLSLEPRLALRLALANRMRWKGHCPEPKPQETWCASVLLLGTLLPWDGNNPKLACCLTDTQPGHPRCPKQPASQSLNYSCLAATYRCMNELTEDQKVDTTEPSHHG